MCAFRNVAKRTRQNVCYFTCSLCHDTRITDPHAHLETCTLSPDQNGVGELSSDDGVAANTFFFASSSESACSPGSDSPLDLNLDFESDQDAGDFEYEQNKEHAGAFHMYAQEHRGEVYLQKWINQHQVTRRAAESLRDIVNTHWTAKIRPMKVQKDDLEKAAAPLAAGMIQRTYKVQDPILAKQLPNSSIEYESCKISSLIYDMLNDPRISSNMHWECEKKINIGGERVFNEMYTAQQFEEIAKHCPAGCFPLAVILYQDETWLTKSGSSADKPLVMSFGNLNQETYVQVSLSRKTFMQFVKCTRILKNVRCFINNYLIYLSGLCQKGDTALSRPLRLHKNKKNWPVPHRKT